MDPHAAPEGKTALREAAAQGEQEAVRQGTREATAQREQEAERQGTREAAAQGEQEAERQGTPEEPGAAVWSARQRKRHGP